MYILWLVSTYRFKNSIGTIVALTCVLTMKACAVNDKLNEICRESVRQERVLVIEFHLSIGLCMAAGICDIRERGTCVCNDT